MDLCGHATLATAHCLKTILNYPSNTILFETLSGELKIEVDGDLYRMDFPSRMPIKVELPAIIAQSFNIQPKRFINQETIYLSMRARKRLRTSRLTGNNLT
jgi:predicted PhzF superfamily epimerase YddE/YHI9